MKRCFCALMLALMILPHPSGAAAGGLWHSFMPDDPPKNLGFLVSEYTGTVKITFLGDCTLGGEEKTRNASRGFVRTIETNGYEYPFRSLRALTLEDDLTVANLEGVLTDRKLPKVEKEYNFSGPAAYARILTGAGIECVTLANNHSHDYGSAGYADTKQALADAGVSFFGTDCVAVWENDDGLLIGFTGVSGNLSSSRAAAYRSQMQRLRQLGCAAVITVMHTGQEYSEKPNSYQRRIVEEAAENGACLVVGHHPHVVQGYEQYHGIPVVYSLGNCSFGGAGRARDNDALVLQAELSFTDSELTGILLRFFPISITSSSWYNNYAPEFLTGKDAERVLTKMQRSTGVSLGSFDEADGAVMVVPAAE